MIIDFSPSVLGLAEGFSQEGFDVTAGVGFSTVHDMTWKVSYSKRISSSLLELICVLWVLDQILIGGGVRRDAK